MKKLKQLKNEILSKKPANKLKENILIYDDKKSSSKEVRWDVLKTFGKIHQNIVYAHIFRNFFIWKYCTNDKYILELGCGNGDMNEILYRNRCRINYVGIEINENCIKKINNRKFKTNFPSLFLKKDLTKLPLPFKNKKFDVIICTEVIEHITKEEGRNLLIECKRLLKDDGILFLSTPDKKLSEGIYSKDHIYEYEYEEIKKLIIETGFKIIKIYGCSCKSKHIKNNLNEKEKELYENLKEYFGGKLLNQIFSVIHPDISYDKLYILKND